jgi:hypothetical protein
VLLLAYQGAYVMAAPGADPFLGLLAGGISFDKKRFARDISLFKPQVRVSSCVLLRFNRRRLALTAGCAEPRRRWLCLRRRLRAAAWRAARAA